MIADICAGCKAVLNGQSNDKTQAEKVEAAFPICACEAISVGLGSPGRVQDDELLYRMIISPGDIDQSGNILLEAFRDVRLDGLSVFRGSASDDDVTALVVDRLTRRSPQQKPKFVQALLCVEAKRLRDLKSDVLGRLFCVYDETVPRRVPGDPVVPTHVTVLQRLHPAKVDNRSGKIKEDQKRLFDLIKTLRVDISDFRGGLINGLNARSDAGDFISEAAA